MNYYRRCENHVLQTKCPAHGTVPFHSLDVVGPFKGELNLVQPHNELCARIVSGDKQNIA